MECVIETKNLVKRYGKVKAVDGLSMRVEKGSIHALVGPNGSGKTTLIRMLMGIAKALLGNPELLILDEPINGMDPQGVSEMRALLFSLKEQGHTILLASHILKELTAVSTHYSMIRDGRLYDDFSAGELSKRCGEWLEIVTPDAGRAEGLLRGMGENITVEGETVQIFGAVDSGEIIRKLVLGDCVVRGVGVKTNDLESYFIKMMGEKI